jgi:uncharacterized protein (TIGR02284 family)
MLPRPAIVESVEELTVHERKNLTALLHDLLNTAHDAGEGYRAASQAVRDPNLVDFFQGCARDRGEAASDLRGLLTELGEETSAHPGIAAELHRSWIALRGAIENGSPTAILAECERGEANALRHYERALHQKIPMRVASVLLGQVSAVRSAHAAYERMRHPW